NKVSLQAEQLVEARLIAYALRYRRDLRNSRDRVIDAARRIKVAENALQSALDFSSAIEIPTEGKRPFDLRLDRVTWSAGFDLDLALQRLPQRNAYRSALIAFAQATRDREALEDSIKADVRDTLRRLRALEKSYVIQTAAVKLASRRVERTEAFMLAGGRNQTQTRDVLEAKDDLLAAQLQVTRALVDFAVAKLQLLRDLKGLPLEPKGLRYDPGLPIPREAIEQPAPPAAPPRGTAPK
ncbi:MAG: TolC family protein, partial [Planctomycetes bacterium]|nr:TolC family protein [Planctomycetota bacterium]